MSLRCSTHVRKSVYSPFIARATLWVRTPHDVREQAGGAYSYIRIQTTGTTVPWPLGLSSTARAWRGSRARQRHLITTRSTDHLATSLANLRAPNASCTPTNRNGRLARETAGKLRIRAGTTKSRTCYVRPSATFGWMTSFLPHIILDAYSHPSPDFCLSSGETGSGRLPPTYGPNHRCVTTTRKSETTRPPACQTLTQGERCRRKVHTRMHPSRPRYIPGGHDLSPKA